MTRDINALAAYFAQCHNIGRKSRRYSDSLMSSVIGLRQSKKSVGGDTQRRIYLAKIPADGKRQTMEQGNMFRAKANSYRKNIWTPIHKGAVQQSNNMDNYPSHSLQSSSYGAIDWVFRKPCIRWRRCGAMVGRRNSRSDI